MKQLPVWLFLIVSTLVGSCGGSGVVVEQPAVTHSADADADADADAEESFLLAAITKLHTAAMEYDIETQVGLFHPALIESLGGHDASAKVIERMSREMQADGFAPARAQILAVSEIVSIKDKLFAIAEYELELSGPDGESGVISSFYICESPAGGTDWRILNGNGLAGQRSKLLLLVPDFPEELTLPESKAPVWN